jgi:hypothetical protein
MIEVREKACKVVAILAIFCAEQALTVSGNLPASLHVPIPLRLSASQLCTASAFKIQLLDELCEIFAIPAIIGLKAFTLYATSNY